MSSTDYPPGVDPLTGRIDVYQAEQPQYLPTGEPYYNPPAQDDNRLATPEPQGKMSKAINRLLGTQFGEERYQTWPERVVRSGTTLPGDVKSGAEPTWDPETGHTAEPVIQRAQDTAGLSMTGGLAGTGERGMVVGSGPVRTEPMPEPPRAKTETVFKDVKYPHPEMDKADWRRYYHMQEHGGEEVELPIRSMNATQKTVDGDYMNMRPNDSLPVVLKKNGEHYVQDGHHRLMKAAAEGNQTAKVELYDLDPSKVDPRQMTLLAKNEAAAPLSALEHGPVWHSPVENALETSTTASAPAAQWLATIKNARGVKPEEMDWLGLHDFLAGKGSEKVSRQELLDHVASQKMQPNDVVKGEVRQAPISDEEMNWFSDAGERRLSPAELARYREIADRMNNAPGPGPADTKYHDYQMPGGENYREHLLTLPNKAKAERSDYRSSHWDEPNILAHVRTNDRMIGDKKSLHIEEVQSDWHQAGRRQGYKLTPEQEKAARGRIDEILEKDKPTPEEKAEYTDLMNKMAHPGVPDAPFKTTWPELALKRMIRRAAEEGHDRISWTPGEAQAARYDLSKSVQTVVYKDGNLTAIGPSGQHVINNVAVPKEKLPDYIGKEAAYKLLKQEPHNGAHTLQGEQLKVGGEGMREFYDKMLPKVVEKIGKAHGVKVQRGQLPSDNIRKTVDDRYTVVGDHRTFDTRAEAEKVAGMPVHYFDIPQSLKDQALQRGMPLFTGGQMFVPAALAPRKEDRK